MTEKDPLLALYFDGDRIGAPAEGMAGATLGYELMLQRQYEYPQGTDESDSVRLFLRFVSGHAWDGDYDRLAVGWARFITAHHAATSYGRTWRSLFALVRYVEKNTGEAIPHAKLMEMSRDWNSCGNGCLALAYPAWRYAQQVGADPFRLARAVTEVSHAHPSAQQCVVALIRYFESGELTALTPECQPPAGKETLFTPLAPGCLWAALECARAETKEDVIRRAAEIGGDVDSYLSLGLLLWGFRSSCDREQP